MNLPPILESIGQNEGFDIYGADITVDVSNNDAKSAIIAMMVRQIAATMEALPNVKWADAPVFNIIPLIGSGGLQFGWRIRAHRP